MLFDVTLDANFAAVLIALGFEFFGVVANPELPTQAYFRFPKDESFDGLRREYLSAKLKVEPQQLFAAKMTVSNALKAGGFSARRQA